MIQMATDVKKKSKTQNNKEKIIKIDLDESPRGIVKYKTNDDSEMLFKHIKGYSAVKSNIIMFILANALHNSDNKMQFSPKELKKFIGFNRTVSNSAFIRYIDWIIRDLASVVYTSYIIEDGHRHKRNRPFFAYTDIDQDTETVTVQISKTASEIFNNFSLHSAFNRFSLMQYFQINSKYSKNLFRILKAYRTLGHKRYSQDELRDLLSIPKSYDGSDIRVRIIMRSLEELSPYFRDFNCEIERKQKQTFYLFTWRKETRNEKDVLYNVYLIRAKAFYNINSNQNLSDKVKDRAVERYFGLKKGKYTQDKEENPFCFLNYIYGDDIDENVLDGVQHLETNVLNFLLEAYKKMDQAKRLDAAGYTSMVLLSKEYDKRMKQQAEDDEDKDLVDLEGLPQYITRELPEKEKGLTYLKTTPRLKALERYTDQQINIIWNRFTQALTKNKANVDLLSDIATLTNYMNKQKKK